MKQPTPINSHQGAALEIAPASVPQAKTNLADPGMLDPRMEDEIRQRAYELYEERGRHHGFEREDWARAEAEIRSKYQQEKSA